MGGDQCSRGGSRHIRKIRLLITSVSNVGLYHSRVLMLTPGVCKPQTMRCGLAGAAYEDMNRRSIL